MNSNGLKILITTVILSIPSDFEEGIVINYSEKEIQQMIKVQEKEAKKNKLEEIISKTKYPELNIQTAYVTPADKTSYGRRLGYFQKFLKKRGHNVDLLFKDSVMIYTNIKDKFRPPDSLISPEFLNYKNCLRAKGKNRCSEEYELAYQYYKKKLQLDIKKQAIPLFIDLHYDFLDSLEQNSGVPKEITAAIIGVESNFGDYTGEYNPFSVFVSFYVNNFRVKMAKNQMLALLDNFSLEEISELNSSHSGALFAFQYMPSSIEPYSIGNPRNLHDNLASIDNYLSSHFNGSYEDAIWAYNRSRMYIKAVLELSGAAVLSNPDFTERPEWLPESALLANIEQFPKATIMLSLKNEQKTNTYSTGSSTDSGL
ncbi:lytic murein transglycosylase [Bacteroidota bacterium]